VIVAPAGEIDLLTAPAVQQSVEELLDRGFRHVVIDLRRVEFLDAQGIRVLLAVDSRARGLGAPVSIVLGPEITRRALELCGVVDRLDIAP
jgi:anti-sigma B factor antagonist